jgi:Dihydrofolate reductase
MIVSMIVALGKNNEIGIKGGLLAHLPADLKHFKEVTSGHTVIMGRKTFESLPKGALPNRRNIVISRNEELQFPNVEMVSSLDQALLRCMDEEEVFIIGGAQIYKQALDSTDKLYLTRIYGEFPEADAFFPEINLNEWKQIVYETFPADEKNAYSFSFIDYERV